MNKLLLLVVLVVGGKFAYDAPERGRVDREMQGAMREINRKLPISTPYVRLDKVTYSDRMVHSFGTLLTTQALTEDAKTQSRKLLRDNYCGYGPALKANIGAEYVFTKATLANMNEKLHEETWSVSFRPQDCL